MSNIISFASVKEGQVFRPVVEYRTEREHTLHERRLRRRVRWERVLSSPPRSVSFEKHAVVREDGSHFDGRTYCRTKAFSVCIENGADAIFGTRDRVEILGHIDDMLAGEENAV